MGKRFPRKNWWNISLCMHDTICSGKKLGIVAIPMDEDQRADLWGNKLEVYRISDENSGVHVRLKLPVHSRIVPIIPCRGMKSFSLSLSLSGFLSVHYISGIMAGRNLWPERVVFDGRREIWPETSVILKLTRKIKLVRRGDLLQPLFLVTCYN